MKFKERYSADRGNYDIIALANDTDESDFDEFPHLVGKVVGVVRVHWTNSGMILGYRPGIVSGHSIIWFNDEETLEAARDRVILTVMKGEQRVECPSITSRDGLTPHGGLLMSGLPEIQVPLIAKEFLNNMIPGAKVTLQVAFSAEEKAWWIQVYTEDGDYAVDLQCDGVMDYKVSTGFGHFQAPPHCPYEQYRDLATTLWRVLCLIEKRQEIVSNPS